MGQGLRGKSDTAVWRAAQSEGRFLITQDLDFSDVRVFAPGTHHGLLVVRLAQPDRLARFRRIHDLFEMEDVENRRQCFVVATNRKRRVKHPA